MARAFGLGRSTGLEQVAESDGLIENPSDAIQAVNKPSGKGQPRHPVQVASFMAALGNWRDALRRN